MIVENNKVVSFHYTLKNEAGEDLETSTDKQAMSYLHGANNIIPGLENAMEGHAAGDTFSVTVAPEEAYGARREANVQRVPLKRLQGAGKLRPTFSTVTCTGPCWVCNVNIWPGRNFPAPCRRFSGTR